MNVELAAKQEAEMRDKIWRENFCSHAIIFTERTVPKPIFVAAMIGVEKLLRIDVDATQGPMSFRAAGARSPSGRGPAFGEMVGFVINYSPVQAVRFDRNGQAIVIRKRPFVQDRLSPPGGVDLCRSVAGWSRQIGKTGSAVLSTTAQRLRKGAGLAGRWVYLCRINHHFAGYF